MRVVVDASVASMWFLPEAHSKAAMVLIRGGYDLIAPELIGAEVGHVLTKAFRRGDITADYAGRSLRLLLEAVERYESAALLDPAFEIARRHGGSFYDALYVALAARVNVPVITNDLPMANTARAMLVPAFTVDNPLPPP